MSENQQSQKDAVIELVKSTLGSSYNESVSAKSQLSKEQIADIRRAIVDGIMDGKISYGGMKDHATVQTYVSGMVSNHLRKAQELNGGKDYVAGGTRSSDPQLVELNKLLKTTTPGSSEHAQVLEAISTRKSALNIKTKKVKASPAINTDLLPDNIKSIYTALTNQ